MEVGDLVVVTNSPFDDVNLFNYQNGDIGIVKTNPEKAKHDIKSVSWCMSCTVILLKDFKEYYLPITYIEKMEAPC